ncbi:cilia- and flagella-associated protein 74-like [Ciona intestinalis]
MEFESVQRFPPSEDKWDESSSDDETYGGGQYDDFEDLFSNETESVQNESDESEIGMYLETEPGTQKEVAQLIVLRRHLDSLQEQLSEKEFLVMKSREELAACRTRTKALEIELNEVLNEIKQSQESENVASYHRLVSQKVKLETEIESDKKLEIEINNNLQESELNLSRVEIEQRHYVELAEQVVAKEERVNQHKMKMAKYRLGKERKAAILEKRKWKNAERDLTDLIKAREFAHEKALEAAIENQKRARKFLKQSLSHVRDKEQTQVEDEVANIGGRVKSIISLKESINSNRENLKALQARDAAFKKQRETSELLERNQVLNEGGNPQQVLLRRKKKEEFEKNKVSFKTKQTTNRMKIVSTILKEEENIERRKKQQPQLWSTKHTEKLKELQPLKKPSIHTKIELTEDNEPIFLQQTKYLQQTPREDVQREVDSVSSSSGQDITQSPSTLALRKTTMVANNEEEDLAQPEFQGMWDQKHKVYKVPKEDVTLKPTGGTKMEHDIMKRTLAKHKDGIIVQQVAAGREFKGRPFNSKPEVIHFKDLDVGRVYKKKITITNVSYSINFCKLCGLSEHLKDFIKIDFEPPGQMSAGMSCDMFVTFKPMINEDLIGEVFFLAQTGPFSIPLKCTTKKCDLSVDVESINFGTQVVGETIRRSVVLQNKGALGSRFDFQKIPENPATTYTLETSLGRLTTAETPGMTPNDVSERLKTSTTIPLNTALKSRRTQQSEGLTDNPQTAETLGKMTEFPIQDDEEYEEQRGDYRDEGDEITFVTPATEYQAVPDELKVGEIMSGEIEPFSSVKLDIIFAPCIPGDIQANFQISFTDSESQPLLIKTKAVAIDVPVWLERQNVDLKVCMYDRLYQEQIVVHNRASTALRLNFEVPKELRNHMELLPKTGYIQAKQTFTAQLKFLPRQTLAEDSGGLFDIETGIVEAPMVIRVADQTRPVPFVINAVVTSSDLEFDRPSVDFGCCGIHESVVSTVKLTNHSILPQLFGFVGIPEYVDIQPNDGFGTILPLETIDIDIIINAKRARDYDFTLLCKSGINREFPLHCRAVGVHPPLELSHQVINFAATALDDVSTSTFHVINSHISSNEFTHPVPRIGKGEIAKVGPTSFEFMVPDNIPISITPSVGTVQPGEKCHITVEFSPKLHDYDVRKEAVRVIESMREEKEKEQEEKRIREAEELAKKQLEEEKQPKGKKTPKTPAKPKTGESAPKSGKSSAKSSEQASDAPLPTPEEIDDKSKAYKAAHAFLTRNYPGSFKTFIIPCLVASGSCSDDDLSLKYNTANTLYLEVHCPVIKPPVVIISNQGHSLTDFGQVSIGQNAIKPISIQNISENSVELKVSVLDTSGPFQMLNALRTLKPDETHTILVSFTPNMGKVFYEVLKIIGPSSELDVCLTGHGVTPVIKLVPDQRVLDLGHVITGETSSTAFMLENQSSLAIKYSIRLDSGSLLRHHNLQQLPDFISRSGDERKSLVGPQNHNGSTVFDCVPCEGNIGTGESHEINVTFQPDQPSTKFSDGARIILFNTEEAHVIELRGKAHDHMMFIEGNDQLDVPVESLTSDGGDKDTNGDAIVPMKNILLSFMSHVSDEGFSPAERKLDIGCVKSIAFAARKNGEWSVDNIQSAQNAGFSIEPLKSTVDADSTKPIQFTWTPPENHDPNVPVTTSVLLTLKGDVTLNYNVILSGLVSFN